MSNLKKRALDMHEKSTGKIGIELKAHVKTLDDLSLAYTPGVAEVCKEIAVNKDAAFKYTMKGKTIAIVSDGSAVLGLGNIGAEAALPVMEGKALLFKDLAGVDAFPVCIASQDNTEIINFIKNIAPNFGGINLEDIAAPRCFEIEEALQDIGIPVMHDDQHGTAIVVLAALINACKVVGKRMKDLKVVLFGAGAAGVAIAKLLKCVSVDHKLCEGVDDIIMFDRQGAIYAGRPGMNKHKEELSKITNKSGRLLTLQEALEGADVFIGVSQGDLLTIDDVSMMHKDAIIFAMSNPTPEIMPDVAKKVAKVVGTGRSDFPNQINNSLAFPGIFKGALDAKATRIIPEMKMAAAHAIADYIDPTPEAIIPPTLDKGVAEAVGKAVAKVAKEMGVCRE